MHRSEEIMAFLPVVHVDEVDTEVFNLSRVMISPAPEKIHSGTLP